MNFIVYAAIIAIIAVPLWIWWDSTHKKGTKVMITWSKFIDDREVAWQPQKRMFGYNRYNKHLRVEEFHLPKQMGKHQIEGLNPDDLEATNLGYPKVHLVQIGEQIFIPKKREDKLIAFELENPKATKTVIMDEKHAGETDIPKKVFFSSAREYLADKDVQGWAMMKAQYNDKLHAEKKKGFDKYAVFILPTVAIIAAIIIIVFAMNKAGELSAEANGEIRESSNRFSKLVDTFIKNQNDNIEQTPTDAEKPPAAQGGGGTS